MLGVKQTPLRTRRCWRSGFTLRLITIIGDIIESAAVFGQSTTQWSREWSKQHKYNRQKKTQTNSFHVMLRSFTFVLDAVLPNCHQKSLLLVCLGSIIEKEL